MHNTQGHRFETTYVRFLCVLSYLFLTLLSYIGKHYFTAVSPVLEGSSYRQLAAGPVWSSQHVSDHCLISHTLRWVKQLFHYLLSVNVGIILGMTWSKSLWYFFCFASLNLLFWLNSADGKLLQTTSQGHLVPINIIKVFLSTLHIVFLISAETYCCENQHSSKALDSQSGVKLAGDPLQVSHSKLSLAPHLYIIVSCETGLMGDKMYYFFSTFPLIKLGKVNAKRSKVN